MINKIFMRRLVKLELVKGTGGVRARRFEAMSRVPHGELLAAMEIYRVAFESKSFDELFARLAAEAPAVFSALGVGK